MTDGDPTAQVTPLSGHCLFLLGRLHGLTRRRLEHLLKAQGCRLAPNPAKGVSLVAIGHSASSKLLPDGRLLLPAGLPESASLISEYTLRRRLGLLPPPGEVERSFSGADLSRMAGLSQRILAALTLFDVIEPVEEAYSYRDLVAAREVGRLVSRGVDLGRVVQAAGALRRSGQHLSQARLTEGAPGELLRDLGSHIAELSGQLTMGLESDGRSVDEIVAEAEAAGEAGDLARAESLYATAMNADRYDPVIPFNLGNVFDEQGRAAEAKIAWQIAVYRDPAFAEAWYNLAFAAEDDEQPELAIAEYRRALQAEPGFSDALYNLALLLTKLDRCTEALPLWEQFLDAEPRAEQAMMARRAAALCRMYLQREKARAG